MSESETRQSIAQQIEQADALPYEDLGCNCRAEFASLVRDGAPRTAPLVACLATCHVCPLNYRYPRVFQNGDERQRWIDQHLTQWGHAFEGSTKDAVVAE